MIAAMNRGNVTRTYLDASVLIAAFQANGQAAILAMEALNDPDRQLVVSDFLRLEVLPKPIFHSRTSAKFEKSLSKGSTIQSTKTDNRILGKRPFATRFEFSKPALNFPTVIGIDLRKRL
jgi:hypothetical protein